MERLLTVTMTKQVDDESWNVFCFGWNFAHYEICIGLQLTAPNHYPSRVVLPSGDTFGMITDLIGWTTQIAPTDN